MQVIANQQLGHYAFPPIHTSKGEDVWGSHNAHAQFFQDFGHGLRNAVRLLVPLLENTQCPPFVGTSSFPPGVPPVSP